VHVDAAAAVISAADIELILQALDVERIFADEDL